LGSHSKIARELFESGYNCAQSVFAAFCDVTGLDRGTALRLSSSFGAGMGRLREVCGAVSAVFMVAGMLYGYTSPEDDGKKAEHYRLLQEFAFRFKEHNGSYICRELLGLNEYEANPVPEERTKAYYEARPCAGLVEYAAQLLDERILENPDKNCAASGNEKQHA